MSDATHVLDFLKTFVGVPYRWHKRDDKITGGEPFWVSDDPPPTREYMDAHDKSIVCAGLINLAARYVGAPIPGFATTDPFAGTTGAWFEHLEAAGLLEPLDSGKTYPAGTLLLRNFRDLETDQGHVAVIADETGDTILHSYATEDYSSGARNAGEVGYTPFKVSNECLGPGLTSYYTHVCYHEYWLRR
jgi:hypothetical protein